MFEFVVYYFDIILYRPLFNALVIIYDYFPGHDFGIAIICLTIIIRFILYPIAVKAVNSQRSLQKLQPKIQEIQKKYKEDKERQAKETLDLYKNEKINPFSSIFLLIIQLPILIALYRVFIGGLNSKSLSALYSFVLNPIHINFMFLGMIDLSKPNLVFAFIAGACQFFQTKMLMPKLPERQKNDQPDMAAMMQKNMMYFVPIMTVLILFKLPSALGLYWIVTGIFSIVQQYLIIKNSPEK